VGCLGVVVGLWKSKGSVQWFEQGQGVFGGPAMSMEPLDSLLL
jgi:hypothetical protein